MSAKHTKEDEKVHQGCELTEIGVRLDDNCARIRPSVLIGLVVVSGLSVACEKRTGEAIVVSKEYIAAAASPAASPAPNRDEASEITVDTYAMPAEDRGTSRDPRALNHEQWLVKVRLTDNGREFNVPADRSEFERVNPGDRVRVRYHVGKYTGTVWGADLVND